MKITSIITLLFLNLSLFGQQSSIITIAKKYTVIGYNDSLKIKTIRRNENSNYYLLIKNKNKIDSLLFDKDQVIWGTDTCIILQKQLDGKGRPEIIIKQIKANQEGSQGIGSSTTFQIWNLDTKTKLFQGVTNWHFELYVLSKEHLDNNYQPTMIDCICTGSYEIEFANNGNLIVKNLYERSINSPYCQTDHKDGIYILTNGKYVFSKENNGN